MNILITADYATPASGNFIGSCVDLGRRLKKGGHKLSFIFPENQNTLAEGSWTNWLRREGFTVYLFQKDMGDNESLSFLKDVIRKENIDILHVQFGLFYSIARRFAKELGVKILIHDRMDFSGKKFLIREKMMCVFRSIMYRKNGISIVCVNPQKARAYLFARRWYVPNGLSLIRNVSKSATREECRSELGIAQDDKVCLFLGWDVYRKGLDIAAKAINEINEKDFKMLLCIVGVGNPPDPERTRLITEYTGIDANSPWIRYLPSCEDMFAYHRAADVYLSASRSEAFSNGILEAISQNIPVVVSDIKGTGWCHDYSKTLIYKTEDYHDCAQALKKAVLITDKESNTAEFIKDYSIEKWCRKMIRIYNSL